MLDDPELRAERARLRRATWQGGVLSLEEMETFDQSWWQRLSPVERIGLVWDLSREGYGFDESSPRLRGSAGGIRSL